MKIILTILLLSILAGCHQTSEEEMIKKIVLLKPDKSRGLTFMETLDVRASAEKWASNELSQQDISDLLWAANGVNRPSSGKRTAPSAQNAQDIDIYVFMEKGTYLYDAIEHALDSIVGGDNRAIFEKTEAPVILVLISDISRFRPGSGYEPYKFSWANIDCGIVSQNISLFCAATGLKTRPKAILKEEAEKIKKLLSLKDTQYVLLHHPVGYGRWDVGKYFK